MPDTDNQAPVPSGPSRGWGTIGFALVVTGLAGLLFHAATGTPILQSHLGQIALGFVALGALLLVIGIARRVVR